MPQSNFSRFADGVQISGVSINVHQKGVVLYVCNSTVLSPNGVPGNNGADGKTPDRPLATIKAALANTVANRGDKIILLPGHAETITGTLGLNLNVAGVSVIADPLAVGSLRPTITLGTSGANTDTIGISAANVVLSGVLLIANFLNIATMIDVSAADVTISGVEFRDTSAILNMVKAIRTSTGADNACDGLTVIGCRMLGLGTSATTALINARSITGRLVVKANTVDVVGTTASSGVLVLATSKALTGALIMGNDVMCPLTTTTAGALIVAGTAGTGFVVDNNMYIGGSATDLLCTASTGLCFFNNLLSAVADASGYLLPAADG